MDVETASALERIIERVDALDTSLGGKIIACRDDLRQEIAALRDEVHAEVGDLRDEISALREGVDAQVGDLRYEISAFREGTHQDISTLRQSVEEVRRHAVILNESTREDIRFVAEAVADLSVRIDSLQR
jgi:archaellum component FlaC